MNRNCYQLVFNATLGMVVPQAETARRRGKSPASVTLTSVVLAGSLLSAPAYAQLPVAANGGLGGNFAQKGTTASYQVNGNVGMVSQVGNKSILNWQSFNVGNGKTVQFRQVDSLATNNLVQGASFTSLNRIWDANPSIISGAITQGAGQQANIILVNNNGIAFMNGAQVNLNNFTASSLNIVDSFINNGLLGGNAAQFNGTKDFNNVDLINKGFVKVMEGAQITAGSQGRVMLLAPTVVNRGTITAPDGQVVLAAGTKAYLSASGDSNVRGLLVEVENPAANLKGTANDTVPANLANIAEDKLGLASNSGTLSTPRGNITMVGYAVNQNGIAKATTSVVANGSVYLTASGFADAANTPLSGNSVAGNVVLGSGSVTTVTPELTDATSSVDGSSGQGLDKRSQVRVVGNRIYMADGAKVIAPSGNVNFLAVDDTVPYKDSRYQVTNKSNTARVDIASGALIDVSGVNDVAVSVARNTVEVQLRGDELKDSPINQVGPLRGQTVYVDIAQAQATPNSLIAKDSLTAYAAKTTRTVAERSTEAGTVNIHSEGETILQNGSTFNLSGGSLNYQSAVVQRSLISSGGKTVDVSKAVASTRYDRLASKLVVDYGRWNKTETFSSGPTSRFVQGYVEGKNAGSLNVLSLGSAFIQSDVVGNTITGSTQRTSGQLPKGASLTIGSPGTAAYENYKINQQVLIKDGASTLAPSFAMDGVLNIAQQTTLELNGQLLGLNKVANLGVYTNSSLLSNAALTAPERGEVTLVANDVTVQKDISVAGGNITIAARNNAIVGTDTNNPSVKIGDNVALRVNGKWVNDKLDGVAASNVPLSDAGSISIQAAANGDTGNGGFLTQGTVSLGQGVQMDVSAGAYMSSNGKITHGKAGVLEISGYSVTGLPNGKADTAPALQAYGATQGGTLKITANKVQLGGQDTAGTLVLDSDFLTRGGFGAYELTGLSTLDVAPGTAVLAQQVNRKIVTQDAGKGVVSGANAKATGTAMAEVGQVQLDDATVRKAVSVSLAAQHPSSGNGVLTVGRGASVTTEAGGTLNLTALNTLDVEGALVARGGKINVLLDRGTLPAGNTVDANALWLGSAAMLDASGVALTAVDSKGQTQGKVLAGGSVSLRATRGYINALKGSTISVAGAAPVWLDIKNENGTFGRKLGSDAGSVAVSAQEALVLDSTFQAQGGGTGYRNGNLSIALSSNARQQGVQTGFDAEARELRLANSVVTPTNNRKPTDVNPLIVPATVVRSRLGVDTLEAGGFDTVAISSRDGIVLEGNLDFGSSRAQPMRELKLDAARIETDGGNATLTADAVRLGNYDTTNRVGTAGSISNAGSLTANARMVELAGNLRLQGMAKTALTGSEVVQLSAVTRDKLNASGGSTQTYENTATISTTADLTLKAGVVTPSAYGNVTLQANGKTIRFEAVGDAPNQPLSALGQLKVQAAQIEQAGRIWAPLGQVALNATNSVTLSPGSVTSVAADTGSVLPLGQIQNGLKWVVNVDPASIPKGQLALTTLPQKSVSLNGTTVDMQSGSTVNVAGGGNLQAYEFTVGPGGSRDILADANIYAVVPSYKGGFAPSDPQERFDQRVGTSIYLGGVPGLKAGTYTLLPAHYALLPGAYAVRLGAVANILPGQEFTKQDGVRVASGYLTDSRSNAPRDATWRGFEVLTGAQVRARSELTVTQASDFFTGDSNRPADAGLLSIATTGQGASSLKINGNFVTAAAAGGRGAAVDISATELAVVNRNTAGNYTTATQVQVDTLNAMGARSVLLGGTRTVTGSTTALQVGANTVTLDNASDVALQAPEVILAASNTVDLKAGSKIVAEGSGSDAGTLTTAGMGALVRVANSTGNFVRSGNPGSTQGTVTGDTTSMLRASKAITLDATKDNSFRGSYVFGGVEAGYLVVGASKINFGSTGSTPGPVGLTYTQAQLDALSSLAAMTFISYSTFDLYGDVRVGGLNGSQRPTLASLTLQGAGLVGRGGASNTASINAKTVQLSNPGALAFSNGGASGTGQLQVVSDTLVLGDGAKTLDGFSSVAVSSGEVSGKGTGSFNVNAPLTVNTARVSGAAGSNQTWTANGGGIALNKLAPSTTLAAASDLGAKLAIQGESVSLNTTVNMFAGSFKALANSGDVTLGSNALVDVSGKSVALFDQTRVASAGRVELASTNGSVRFDPNAQVDVSGAAGGDAGTLVVSAAGTSASTVQWASGNLRGTNAANAQGVSGEGARVQVDVGTLGSFTTFNGALGNGFSGQRQLRVRNGDVTVSAGDVVRANTVDLSADAGKLTVNGEIRADGAEQAGITLNAGSDLTLSSGALLSATSSASGKAGGSIALGSTSGTIVLDQNSGMDVSALAGGVGGQVNLRAARNANGVNIAPTSPTENISSILGASAVTVEAVRTYTGVTDFIGSSSATLTKSAWNGSSTLSLGNIAFDNDNVAANAAAIAASLGTRLDPSVLRVRAGVEVQSALDLTVRDANLNQAQTTGKDLNFSQLRTNTTEPGSLTLRAGRNLFINANVSDGFANPTRNTTPTGSIPATPLALNPDGSGANSWSYRLVAGADNTAANVMTTKAMGATAGNLTLAANKMVRTGTGSIAMAAANDIVLSSKGSVVYTAGQRYAASLPNFVAPIAQQSATFTRNGGDVSLIAGGNVSMVASDQLYSEWLFRQGTVGPDGATYYIAPVSGNTPVPATPAWWTRFDLFRQGVATLGGGNVSITAGADLINVGASAATQGRVNSATVDASKLLKTGGGNVRLEALGNVRGGEFYADNGSLLVKAGGQVGGGVNSSVAGTVYPVIALGDASARVQAQGDVNILAVVNPTLLPQSVGSTTTGNLQANLTGLVRRTAFSTYGDASGVSLSSVAGNVVLHTKAGDGAGGVSSLADAYTNILVSGDVGTGGAAYLPSSGLVSHMPSKLEMLALQGDITLGTVRGSGDTPVLMPSTTGQLDLLAKGKVTLNTSLTMSDRDPALVPRPVTPSVPLLDNVLVNLAQTHAATPVHLNDMQAAHIYAVTGDVIGVADGALPGKSTAVAVSKALQVRAGQDVKDFNAAIQNANENSVSVIQAGRDISYTAGINRTEADGISVSGPGRLEVTAGRNLELATSGGIRSLGNLENGGLPNKGADLHIAAGVGDKGINYAQAVSTLLANLQPDKFDSKQLADKTSAAWTTLWQARWLVGDDSLSAEQARSAVAAIATVEPSSPQAAETQRQKVRNMVFTALRTTGRDYNDSKSPFFKDYSRGYAALDLLFPGIQTKANDGSFANYKGDINMFASRIKSEGGGNIEYMVPGGKTVVGLANTPEALVGSSTSPLTNVLGMVVASAGDIQGFARGDVIVNQSRILTLGGGDVMLWSSEGGIDAGKGKKTASAVPPPVLVTNYETGTTKLVLQGAATGSGIGALATAGATAGDVDLIAPKGTVNAGDAGIRAGNLNVAALDFKGADNISVSGKSAGVPVADMSAVTAAASGASTMGDDASKSVAAASQNASDATRNAQSMATSLRPPVVRVDVLGFGE